VTSSLDITKKQCLIAMARAGQTFLKTIAEISSQIDKIMLAFVFESWMELQQWGIKHESGAPFSGYGNTKYRRIQKR
jgi:hypothetical protein